MIILIIAVFAGFPLYGETVYEIKDETTLIAREDEKVLWETYFADLDEIKGPIEFGSNLYLGQLNHLFQIDYSTGEIIEHYPFPGKIASIGTKEHSLVIECSEKHGYEDDRIYTETFIWKPGDPAIPTYCNGSLYQARFLHKMAEYVLEKEVEKEGIADPVYFENYYEDCGKGPAPTPLNITRIEKETKNRLQPYLPILERLHSRHKSNPWYLFRLAQIHFLLGNSQKAEECFKGTTGVLRSSTTALNMSSEAYGIGQKKWSQQMYDFGCRLRYKEGFVPQFPSTLIRMVIDMYVADYVECAVNRDNLDEAGMLLERTYTVAPRTEAAAFAYGGLMKEFKKAGNTAKANLWQSRMGQAKPYSFFSGVNLSDWHFISFTVCMGCVVVYFLLLVAIVMKAVRRHRSLTAMDSSESKEEQSKPFLFFNRPLFKRVIIPSNPFRYCTRGEYLSFLLLLLAGVYTSLVGGAIVENISFSAGADLAAISGNPGHVLARNWYEQLDDCNAKHNLLGLHYFVRNEYEKAIEEFKKCKGSMSALNNLGASLKKTGQEDNAKETWTKVTEGEFVSEARYNLTGIPEGFWGEYARRHFPGELLLTPPSTEEWHEMLEVRSVFGNPFSICGAFSLNSFSIGVGQIVALVLFLVVTLSGMATAWHVFQTPVAVDNTDTRGWQWWLGVLIPGSARQWMCFGSVVCVVWVSSYIIFGLNGRYLKGILSIIEAISIPSTLKSFGVGMPLHEMSGLRAFIASTYRWLPITILLVNFAFMIGIRLKNRNAQNVDSKNIFVPGNIFFSITVGIIIVVHFLEGGLIGNMKYVLIVSALAYLASIVISIIHSKRLALTNKENTNEPPAERETKDRP